MTESAEDNEQSQVEENEESSVDLIYEEMRWGLEIQKDLLGSIEGKAATLMGFSGAILALLFGSLEKQTLFLPVRIAVIAGVVLSSVAILMASLVFWSKRIRMDPSPEYLLKNFYDKDLVDTQMQVAVNRANAFTNNQKLIERTASLFRVSMLIQIGSIVALAVAILLSVIR